MVRQQTIPESPRSLRDLPPFPPIALKVLRLLSNEDVETKEIADTIAADPVFTGELLRLANSPLFGLPRQVKTLRLAVVVPGRDRLRGLTMSVALRSYMRVPRKPPHLQDWWRHSLACALLTDGLAAACSARGDYAYTAGLVHNIGRLGLMTIYPKGYARFLRLAGKRPVEVLELERKLFGLDHCEAGRLLMEQWDFPRELIAPAAHHHEEPRPERFGLETLVCLGCRLADTLGFEGLPHQRQWTLEEIRSQLPEPGRDGLALGPEVLKAVVSSRIDPILSVQSSS